MLVDDYGRRVQPRPSAPPPPRPPRYEAETEQKVRTVQRENALPETGRVDKDTLHVLQQRAPGAPADRLGDRLDTHGLLGPGDEGAATEELHGLLDAYDHAAQAPAPAPQAPPPPPAPARTQSPSEGKGFWDRVREGGRELVSNAVDNGRRLVDHAVANGQQVVGHVVDYGRNQAGDLVENRRELAGNLAGNGVELVRDTVGNGVDLARDTAANGRELAQDLRESPMDYTRDLAEFGANQGGDIVAYGRDQAREAVEYGRDQAGDIVAYGRNQAADTLGNVGNLAGGMWHDGRSLVGDLAADGRRLGQQALGDTAEGAMGLTPLGDYEQGVLDRLNSKGDKAFLELGGSIGVGVTGDILRKGRTATRAVEDLQGPGGANQAVDSTLGFISSIGLTVKASGTASAEVAVVENPETKANEYQVTVKKTAQVAGSLDLPLVPGGIQNSWGEVTGNLEDAKSVTMGISYTFKTKEEARKGMELLKKQEATGGVGLVDEERAWLAQRHASTDFDFGFKVSGGVTGSRDMAVPGSKLPVVSGTAETGFKAESGLKVSLKSQPGKPPELTVEYKAVASREQGAKMTVESGAEFSGGTQAKAWENEVTIACKYDLKPGENPLDYLTGEKGPKAIEFKGSQADFDTVVPGSPERPDSRKVAYSKTYGPGQDVDWKREAGFLGSVLMGRAGSQAEIKRSGYTVEETRIDASGIELGGGVTVPFLVYGVPAAASAAGSLKVGIDDETAVG